MVSREMIGLLILLEERPSADESRPSEAELASLRLKRTHKVSKGKVGGKVGRN